MLSTLSDPGRGWGSDDTNRRCRVSEGRVEHLSADLQQQISSRGNLARKSVWTYINNNIALEWYIDLDIYLNICRSWTRDEGSLQKGVGVSGYPFYRPNQA